MRCAIIEADTREEVMREMEDRMRAMEQMYSRRLMNEVSLFTWYGKAPLDNGLAGAKRIENRCENWHVASIRAFQQSLQETYTV